MLQWQASFISSNAGAAEGSQENHKAPETHSSKLPIPKGAIQDSNERQYVDSKDTSHPKTKEVGSAETDTAPTPMLGGPIQNLSRDYPVSSTETEKFESDAVVLFVS